LNTLCLTNLIDTVTSDKMYIVFNLIFR